MKLNTVLLAFATFLISTLSFSQSQGPNSTTFVQNFPCSCPSAMGGLWISEFQATTSDNLYAQVRVRPFPNCITSNCWWSRHLYAANYTFSVPANAMIVGLEAFVERSATQGSFILDSAIQMMYNTVPAGVNKAISIPWSMNDSIITYGGPNDMWGLSFTPTEVNTPSFGMYVKIQNTSTIDTIWAYVDHVQMTVYYQTPTGFFSQTSTAQMFNAWYDDLNNDLHVAFDAEYLNKDLSIGIYDLNGRLLYYEAPSCQLSGIQDLSLDAGNFIPGIYFVRLTGSGKEYSKKIIIPGTTR